MRVLSKAARADVVVLQRRMVSGPFLWLLRRFAKKLVFDFDDAIFCNSDGSASASRNKRFSKTLSVCDAAWAGNDYLASHARSDCDDVAVLPTAVDFSRYDFAIREAVTGGQAITGEAVATESQVAPESPVVGESPVTGQKLGQYCDCVWIGSSSTRRYLDGIIPILESLAANSVGQYPQLRLKVIADFTPESATLPIVAVPWSDLTEREALVSADIGIAPMVHNDWTAGKCGLKVIQYMAAGLPVVTDKAGVNQAIVKPGQTGFVASSPQQWQDGILQLIENPALRKKMGQEGRRIAQQSYDITVTCDKMAALLNAVISGL